MSKRRNGFAFTWIHAVAATIGATAIAMAVKRRRGIQEIPSSKIPPAYLPGVGGQAPALAAAKNLGTINLRDLWDPKIIVLKPGGRVSLRATHWRWLNDDTVRLEGAWTGTRDGSWQGDHWTEPFSTGGGGGVLGLWNVGGPGAKKVFRVVDPAYIVNADGQWEVGCGKDNTCNLNVSVANDWGPDDWAQIRLYAADVVLAPEERRYDGGRVGGNAVESIRVRTDLPPVQTVWIMGAR